MPATFRVLLAVISCGLVALGGALGGSAPPPPLLPARGRGAGARLSIAGAGPALEGPCAFAPPPARAAGRLRAPLLAASCSAKPPPAPSGPPARPTAPHPRPSLREGLKRCLLSLGVVSSLALGSPAVAEEPLSAAPSAAASAHQEQRALVGVRALGEAAGIQQGWLVPAGGRDGSVVLLAADTKKGGGGAVEEGKGAAAVDAEHGLLNEVLNLVDEHFLDLNNKEGVVDSAKTHVYNGISWDQVRQEASVKELKDKKQTYKEIEKVLARLGDRYTRFLSPTEFQKLTKYDVTGVGLLLIERGGGLYVAAPPLSGSTSAEAGLQKGDRLLKIDGQDVREGKTPFEGSELLSGQAGTSVEVMYQRTVGGVVEQKSGQLKRTVTVDNPVTTYVVTAKDGSKVGYMRMKEFNAACKRAIAEAVSELKQEGVDSYMLDLRGNPGGVLEGSLEIAGLFMNEDQGKSKRTIVYVIDRNGKQEPIWAQPRLTLDTKTPIFVLVDKKSASASEVLAGSLHDNCRAVVIGKENSYGKGLIQGAFPLSDGSGLVLTVAKYLTPKLNEIQGVGVIPDIDANVGDARQAIKSGKLDLKKAMGPLSQCEPPKEAEEQNRGLRSGTDNTLQMLNGDGGKTKPQPPETQEEKASLFPRS